MSKQLKEAATPVLVNNLVVKTKRLDSSASTRSMGSPIDTFLETQKIFLKNQKGNNVNNADNNENEGACSDVDDMDDDNQSQFYRASEIEPRISISESCIESDSDSEDMEHTSIPANSYNNGYNTHSPMSMVFDTKSHSNLHLVNEQCHSNSQRNSIYKSTFTTSSSSLDTVEEKLKNGEEFDHAIEEEDDEYNADNKGRLPSAGNYLTGIKGSGSTVARTTSISQNTRPKIDNVEQAIVARASPIQKYKNRSRSFNSGLVQKQRRSSSSASSNLDKSYSNSTHTLLMKDNHPPYKTEYEDSGNLIKKINSSTRKSTDNSDKKSHLRNQVYPSKKSNESVPQLPMYQSNDNNVVNWRTDKDGVPLLLETSQTKVFFKQFCNKFHNYMEMESIPSLKLDHEKRVIMDKEFDKDEYIKFMEYPTSDLLEMMSSLLTKIIHTNDNLEAENETNTSISSNIDLDPTLLFRGQNIPKLPINKYLQRAHHYCATSNDVYLSLLVYFDRLSQPNRDAVTNEQIGSPKLILDSYNIHRLIITAFTVATKFSQDIYFTNKRYAKVGGISDNELNKLELVFLDLLSWERLSCSGPELLKYWRLLHNFWERESVALK